MTWIWNNDYTLDLQWVELHFTIHTVQSINAETINSDDKLYTKSEVFDVVFRLKELHF